MLTLAILMSVLMSVACLGLAIRETKQSGELVTPWSLVLVLAVFDIFGSAFVFLVLGVAELPPWVRSPTPEILIEAMGVFALTLVFFRVGYVLAAAQDTGARRTHRDAPQVRIGLNVAAAYVFLVLSGVVYVLYLQKEIARSGSIDSYLSEHLRARWVPQARTYPSLWETVLNQLQPSALFVFETLVVVM